MAIASVSTKGQITLPSGLRKRFGIEPHDRVVIEGAADAIVIRPVRDFMELEGFLGSARSGQDEETAVETTAAARSLGLAKE